MRYIVFLLLFAILACGCSRATNIPTHNLEGTGGGWARTLVLTDVPPEGRAAALDFFMDSLRGGYSMVVVARGDAVPEKEAARMEDVLLSRGVPQQNISRRLTGQGETLGLVFAYREPSHELDTYWFSRAAVSPEFGRSTNANFAAQTAVPSTLSQPMELGAPNPMGAVGPVERYQSGQTRELRGGSFSPGGK